jgi:hypothetical protein
MGMGAGLGDAKDFAVDGLREECEKFEVRGELSKLELRGDNKFELEFRRE